MILDDDYLRELNRATSDMDVLIERTQGMANDETRIDTLIRIKEEIKEHLDNLNEGHVNWKKNMLHMKLIKLNDVISELEHKIGQ